MQWGGRGLGATAWMATGATECERETEIRECSRAERGSMETGSGRGNAQTHGGELRGTVDVNEQGRLCTSSCMEEELREARSSGGDGSKGREVRRIPSG